MATYQPFKTKSFKLKKDAKDYLRDFKKRNQLGDDKYKVETNFKSDNPLPWTAIILKKV